jgi:hypothetical protein
MYGAECVNGTFNESSTIFFYTYIRPKYVEGVSGKFLLQLL